MSTLPKINLKPTIPEELKSEVAETKWGKILSVTPVILTVIATMLAGLASSEMTRAQYERSLAAQRQSKAGDQWNFFQGKRLRGLLQRSTLDLLTHTGPLRPIDPATLRAALAGTAAAAALAGDGASAVISALTQAALPKASATPVLSPAVHEAMRVLEEARPEAELNRALARVAGAELDAALRALIDHANGFDTLIKPVGQAIDTIERQLASSPDAALRRDFTAARLQYTERRYDAEARMNQTIAGLYELQVRRSNLAAERHHRRSSRFFYGMLAGQLGVIVSTLAIAARKRNLLWGIAAAAGGVAISFAVYVMMYV